MRKLFDLDLQLFGGEGAGASGASDGAGQATSGESAAVDAGQKLRELGVPEHLVRKRVSKATSNTTTEVKNVASVESTPTKTQEAPPEKVEEKATKRLTWDEIKNDPEYNKEIQKVVQARLRESKSAQEALNQMTPAIELMARKYGLNTKNMDYNALAQAINNDDAYYEDKAMELGTSIETAKRIDMLERDEARRKQAEQENIKEQMMRKHFVKLEEQSAQLQKLFPKFDLRTELQNPNFARMLSPSNVNAGITVEDAYYAVHRKEIQAASMKVAAEKTAERISNSIQAGQRRPDELGATHAPSESTFDYKHASKAQRDAIKAQIKQAAMRGEKLYPNQINIIK